MELALQILQDNSTMLLYVGDFTSYNNNQSIIIIISDKSPTLRSVNDFQLDLADCTVLIFNLRNVREEMIF